MILTDSEIISLCKDYEMMTPYIDKSDHLSGISHGPTPNGYDIRLGDHFKRLSGYMYVKQGVKTPTLHNYEGGVIPKNGIDIQPKECILLESLETFNMPPNITGIIMNKSTWSRLFISGPNTVIDGGFKGKLTLAFRNDGPWPVCIEKGMGLSHIIFHKSSENVLQPYKGKYQGDKEVTEAK